MLATKNIAGRLASTLALLLTVAAAHAQDNAEAFAFEPFSANYKVKVGIANARSSLELIELEPNRYELVSLTEATGLVGIFKRGRVYERTIFRVADGEILTEYLAREDTLSGQKRDVEVFYRPEQGEADIVFYGETETVEIPPDTYNPLLMQVALMQDLPEGTAPDFYNVLDHVGLRQYTVTIGDEDQVKTPLGGFDAIPVDLINEVEDAGTRVFVAPQAEWVAVKVEARKGDDVKATLRVNRISDNASS